VRVILLAPEYPGLGPSFGVGAYLATIGRALTRAGAEVMILAATSAGCHRIRPGEAPEPLARWRMPALLRPAAAAAVLEPVARAWRPAVVEAPNWGGLGAIVRGDWAPVVRLSTPVGAIAPRSTLRRLAARGHHAWEERSVRRARSLIANSRAMAELGERVYGRAADAIIPHAWEGELQPPRREGDEVLCVGRLEHRKGTDLLIQAWTFVASRLPHARLHLVGPDVAGFGATAMARWRPERVTLHGHLDDDALAALRARCRVQAIPSRYESFGLVALEAWGAGLAVVASRCGGLAEVVHEAGALVAPEDPERLAAAITGLLVDPARAERFALAGQERLQTLYSPEACARATLTEYRRILGS
jgi:glycosyltransferase involved in cell wall biosynthesis